MKLIIKILYSRGFVFIWQYFFNNILFDLLRGTNTYKRKLAKEYNDTTNDIQYGVYYVGIKTSTLKKIFKFLDFYLQENLNDYQFVDLGCGKAKSIIYYLELMKNKNRFRPIGLEYDKELLETANSNLKKLKLINNVKLCHSDARNYLQFLDTKSLIIYMYNPFSWVIMRDIIKNLDDNFINCIICYVDPVEHHNILLSDFKLIEEVKGKYPADCFNIYKKHPRHPNSEH